MKRKAPIHYGRIPHYSSTESAIKDLSKVEKRQKEARAQVVTLAACRGCGNRPVEVGTFGRYKYVCPLYVEHSLEAMKECERPDSYKSCRDSIDAAVLWNSMQTVNCERTVRDDKRRHSITG